MKNILALIGWFVINTLGRTLRISVVDANDSIKNAGNKIVFGFWHGEQFVPFFYHRKQGVVIMSSLSKDGQLQADILHKCGYFAVRGSSSKGGQKALVELIRKVKTGVTAAFALDGPRGPQYQAKPGAALAAIKTGSILLPVSSYSKSNFIFQKAWDKYELPLPFSQAVIAYGMPINTTKDSSAEELSLELGKRTNELSKFTHEAFWSHDLVKYLSNHPRPKILIVQPSRLGDVIFALPAVCAIRKRYPNAYIAWAVDERCAQLIEDHSTIDKLFVFNRSKASIGYVLNYRKLLRAENFDLSIDFHGLFKSAFLVCLAGAKFKLASSSTRGMKELSWVFSKEIKPEVKNSHCVVRHLAVAKYLDCHLDNNAEYGLNLNEDALKSASEILKNCGVDLAKPFVVLFVGGGWISRRWPKERFAKLCDEINNNSIAQVVLIGGKEGGACEKGLNEKIIAISKTKIFDTTGLLSLKQLMAVLSKAVAFVGNEAGPMHIARALGTPSVAIIGPTDPNRTGPYGKKIIIVRKSISCQPCRNRKCKNIECMRLIEVDDVLLALKKALKGEFE